MSVRSFILVNRPSNDFEDVRWPKIAATLNFLPDIEEAAYSEGIMSVQHLSSLPTPTIISYLNDIGLTCKLIVEEAIKKDKSSTSKRKERKSKARGKSKSKKSQAKLKSKKKERSSMPMERTTKMRKRRSSVVEPPVGGYPIFSELEVPAGMSSGSEPSPNIDMNSDGEEDPWCVPQKDIPQHEMTIFQEIQEGDELEFSGLFDLRTALMRVNLMRYYERMAQECVKPENFALLTVEEWRELGVALGHRKKLIASTRPLFVSAESSDSENIVDPMTTSTPNFTELSRRSQRAASFAAKPGDAGKYDVFISYRRKDGMDLAGRVHAELLALGLFPFYDRECLPVGEFSVALEAGIRNSHVFLPLLTDGYLDVERMLSHESEPDFCRAELEAAMGMGKPIIPVVQEGFTDVFDRVKELPSPLNTIFDNDIVSVSNEYFAGGTIAKIYNKVVAFRAVAGIEGATSSSVLLTSA